MAKDYKTGTLKHNAQGRYAFEDGTYFTSDEPIELRDEDTEEWISGRIEFSHKYNDYYFVNEDEGIYIYDLGGYRARYL